MMTAPHDRPMTMMAAVNVASVARMERSEIQGKSLR